MTDKNKKGCEVLHYWIGDRKYVSGVRCLDDNAMCIYDGHEEAWHGETVTYFYKCPVCREQYYATQVLVDTSA